MKRVFVIILTVVLLIAAACLTGCSNGSNALSESHSHELSNNAAEVDDKTVEIEFIPDTFASFSEFASAVKKAETRTSDSSVVDDANIGAISYYYAPEKAFEGFELAQIEVLAKRIIMYYIPNSSTSKVFDYNTGIIVTYAREEATTSKNPLAALADQVGMDLTDEGYLYEQERNTITFAVGNSWMSIRVPDDMNEYEQLAPLCVATKNTIK